MRKGRRVSGHLYKRAGSSIWWVKWQSGKKPYYQSTGETSKPKAREKADQILDPFKAQEEADTLATIVARMRKEESVAQKTADITNRIKLSEVWRRFPYDRSQPRRARGQVRALSPMNIAQNKRDWEQFVDWAAEHHKTAKAMQDVTPEIAQSYSDYLFNRKKVTAGRHNKLITTCNVMYRLAKVPSPFAEVTKYKLPKEAEHREPFTVEQVQKLIGAAEGELRGLLTVLYFTGLRAGDAVQLQHKNRVVVQKIGSAPVRKIFLKTAKTGADINIIEHPLLTKMLAEVCGDSTKGPLFPELAAAYQRDPHLIIKRFNRLMARAFGKDFERTEERTGIGVLAIARFGMHSFRHSLATHCATAGVPIAIVQKWLGHASSMITRAYQHVGTEDQERVVAAIPKLALPGFEGDIIEAEVVEVKTGAGDELFPTWVVQQLQTMTSKNWKLVRDAMLAKSKPANPRAKGAKQSSIEKEPSVGKKMALHSP